MVKNVRDEKKLGKAVAVDRDQSLRRDTLAFACDNERTQVP